MAAPMLQVGGAANPQVVQQHQQAVPTFYYGDVVKWTAQLGLLGTVVYQVEDPDANERSDVDGMDVDAAAARDEQQQQTLPGQVGRLVDVVWLDAPAPTKVPAAELSLVDRPLKHGAVVQWSARAGSSVGRVVKVQVHVDLRMQDDGTEMRGVDTREVAKVHDFAGGDMVVKGEWAGRVVDLEELVEVKFDFDGAVCTVANPDPRTLVRNAGSGGGLPDAVRFPYYPGQRVTVASREALHGGEWIPHSARRRRRVFPAAATVVDVVQGPVTVQWTHCRPGATMAAPSAMQDLPKVLTPLTQLRRVDWKLGDAGIVRPRGRVRSRCGRVVRVRTVVDVAWRAGGTDRALAARELQCVHPWPPGMWPCDLVTERRAGAGDGGTELFHSSDSSDRSDSESGGADGGVPWWWLEPVRRRTGVGQLRVAAPRRALAVQRWMVPDGAGAAQTEEEALRRRTGVVQWVDARRGLLVVWWLGPDGRAAGTAQTVGTDRVVEHDELDHEIGDIVIRQDSEEEVPWIGQVQRFRDDGTVSVVWSDGSRSQVTRNQVRIQPYYHDDSDASASSSSGSSSGDDSEE